MFNITCESHAQAKILTITISKDTNTNITVGNFFNHSMTMALAFAYMQCQFEISALRRLSFSLPKLSFFPTQVEFVGVNIGVDYNMPAKSKHILNLEKDKPTGCWIVQ